MKAISFSVPVVGGVWTVFETLRTILKSRDVDLRWVGAGARAASLVRSSQVDTDLGLVLVPEAHDEEVRAKALYEYVEASGAQLLIFHVLGGDVETNLARYLPTHIKKILIVHNITPGTYRAARAIRDYVHAVVAVCPRIRADLVKWHGFNPSRCTVILTGTDVKRDKLQCGTRKNGLPKVAYVGRVEDSAKGVFWLPLILREVLAQGIDAQLTIIGPGPDMDELRRRFGALGLSSQVEFVGGIDRERAVKTLCEHDVLLLPSRYEGLGLVLAEAMAVGCVPVASRITGVTDAVVKHGCNGFLFSVGDYRSAAQYVAALFRNREVWEKMSKQAEETARTWLGIERMASLYGQLIECVFAEARQVKAPEPMDKWRMHPYLRPAWWHWLPRRWKGWMRVTAERGRMYFSGGDGA